VASAADPPVGTVVTATATCPAGRVLLGGGSQVTDGPGASSTTATTTSTSGTGVAVSSSYPTAAHAWKAVGVVTGPLTAGTAMSVQAYVICGTP
jgi:hypothetical protein